MPRSRPDWIPASEETPNIGLLLGRPHMELVAGVHARLEIVGCGDVRPAHEAVFQVIDAEGTRVTDLAVRAGMTKQAMTELVTHLEDRGYVVRVPDPRDGRAKLVRLTARGWSCIAAAREIVCEIEREWRQELGEERLDLLRELLGELNATICRWVESGGRDRVLGAPASARRG